MQHMYMYLNVYLNTFICHVRVPSSVCIYSLFRAIEYGDHVIGMPL